MADSATLSFTGADSVPIQWRRARVAVSVIFLAHGILISSWLSRIPAVQERLHIPVGVLGTILLSAAAGAMVAMPLTSKLVGAFGSPAVTLAATAALCVAMPLPGVAPRVSSLAAFLFLYGASAGTMDVAMNTQAVTVEAASGRRVMVAFHALFSFGGMIGSLLGSAAARYGIEPRWHLPAVSLLMAAMVALVSRMMIPDRREASEVPQPMRDLLVPLLGLGAIAFCILVGEGAMADWSAVYLNQLAGLAVAPLGYAVFSLTMATGRLAGDWFHEHLGAVSTVRWGSVLATLGLAGALAVGNVPATLLGFACVGFGFSAIFPIVCSVAGARAGNRPQAGVAAVSMTGYFGFLVGPPVIGMLAQAYTLRWALLFVAGLSGLTCLLAGTSRAR